VEILPTTRGEVTDAGGVIPPRPLRRRDVEESGGVARRNVPAGLATSPSTIAQALPIFLRHGSPRILLVSLVAAVAARSWIGAWSAWDLVPVAGVLAYWPLQEWLIHVFILHFKPVRVFGRTIDPRVPRSHRAHHREPWNYEILFIPMHSFIYSLPLTILIWLAITPTAALAASGVVAAVVLSLHYEWVHFLVHTRVTPRTRFYQRLWRNHRLHHFKNEHYWYGVTRLEGDWLLGTNPPPERVVLSETAKTLA
jgi:Fatty acid hydroxylase